jgi:hypothetical protein
LEKFFDLIRQNSHGDDVFSTALLIIGRTCVILRELHELGIRVEHRGRDNLGRTLIGPGSRVFSQDDGERLYQSFVAISNLGFCDSLADGRLFRVQLMKELEEWVREDVHHETDPVFKFTFTRKACNHGITARNVQKSGFPPPESALRQASTE